MKCFYHKSDLDGHCSGAIIKQEYPECEMIGVGYKDTLDLTTIELNETIYVVDFSFSVEEMQALNERAQLIWLDHHKSAIEKMEGINVEGLRIIGKAGCELTWSYLHPYAEMPNSIRLLGRYDVWDHSDPDTLPFQFGMRQQKDTYPDSDIWGYLFHNWPEDVKSIVSIGEIILSYQAKQDTMYAKGMAFEAEFHGYKAIVMNKPYSNSKVFDSIYDPDKHDIMILFGVKPGKIKYTLYCGKPDIDVSKIAIKYGGGGHAGAAGFYTDKLLF